MKKLLEKVEKELDNVAEKGLTSSNLDTTYKLIDIYKDIKEAKYYECNSEGGDYNMRPMGDYRMEYNRPYDDNWYGGGRWEATGRYDRPMVDEKSERYFNRIRQGMEEYNAGRGRYRGGDTEDRMLEGMEMTMAAVCMFIENLCDFAETPKEKEIIRKHIDKMKKI